MKQIVIICAVLLSTAIWCGCDKKEIQPYKTVLKGYIYNSRDSTPFRNTRFKFYNFSYATPISSSKTQESFFFTDEGGYFNHTTSQSQGVLAWPSYHEGSAYIGPPYLGNSKRFTSDKENRINTYHYDTLYTEPYQ